jgi:DNA-directed RNA polymerase specialized sigma24 family protein
MQRPRALGLIPPLHAAALELADQGLDDAELARLLGVEVSAVGPLLRIARSKLEAVEALEVGPDPAG